MDSDGQLLFQTVDHTLTSDMERLTEGATQGLGYSIPKCRVGKWRLEVGEYDFQVARSLEGSFATSKGVISMADVSVLPVSPGMTALVATDGLWEVIDSAEACLIVSKLKIQKLSAAEAAMALCYLAYEKAASDNISAVVVYLN